MNTIKKYKNKIINADCLNILRELPDKSIDLILTDPPYELKLHGTHNMGTFADRKRIKMKHIEKRDFICIEKDENIYKQSVEWLNNSTAQKSLF